MSSAKIETTQGLCVIALTKHLMKKFELAEDTAYAKLIDMELYLLLMDSDTGLYLETNHYLCEACDIELNNGKDALYEYINKE